MDASVEPDLHPLYPSTAHIAVLLSSHSGLTPEQKEELVKHCLLRACLFGEPSVLQHLLTDPNAQSFVDLGSCDDDGLGLVSLTIQGFGSDSERDVEREECARLLIAQGADLKADKAGWTPLHHAALLATPSLISYLMTHGCSPFDSTRRKLTPLDIVTAHSVLPGREDVALLLEEAMKGEGWTGGRMETQRRRFDEQRRRKGKRKDVRDDVGRVLGVNSRWWGHDSDDTSSESELDEEPSESLFTPPVDYSTMLVFSPKTLPQILESLITNFQPSFRDAQPANTLYMLARFACLTCDHNWLEDVIVGATDAIEERFFSHADDVTCLVFWLYNTTVWLHLLQCDKSLYEACEMLGSFELIEEVINSIFVFIIRYAERKIDESLDAAFLDYSSLGPEFDSVQFESSWSLLRPFTSKAKTPTSASAPKTVPSAPASPGIPASATVGSPSNKGFTSLRQSFGRNRASSTTPAHNVFADAGPSPRDVTSFFSALHTLMTLSDINPALIVQLWSQVMYWTACEIFNRVLTRKKYLCRSKAVQISVNLGALEEWMTSAGLPKGVQSHFAPVRDLLNWLKCLSSITEFPDLVATIQKMKDMNPLQMRRAVRDYKYEVNEGHMTEECVQYLTQLQKDWERHRVKLGVEALRKEMVERDKDRESVSSFQTDAASAPTISSSTTESSIAAMTGNIDLLFETAEDGSSWEPPKPPQVLGELLDSRYMLPLMLPSDPRLLAVLPHKPALAEDEKVPSPLLAPTDSGKDSPKATKRGWKSRYHKLREVKIGTLNQLDGAGSVSRWTRPVPEQEDEEEGGPLFYASDEGAGGKSLHINTNTTPLTKKPSARRGRQSQGGGEVTPVEHRGVTS